MLMESYAEVLLMNSSLSTAFLLVANVITRISWPVSYWGRKLI